MARDYFAALVNIKVIYFLEHGLALAEIAKLRELPGCGPLKLPSGVAIYGRICPLPRTTYL